MIVICEPQMKGMSHEKVNSGFIYGLRLAYPLEKMLFCADASQIEAMKNIFINDHIIIEDLEYLPIEFHTPLSIRGIVEYYNLFQKIFQRAISGGTNKIFFLSIHPILLYFIKQIKTKQKFYNIQAAFVLHGEFENIAFDRYKELPVPVFPSRTVIEKAQSLGFRVLVQKAQLIGFRRLIQRTIKFVRDRGNDILNKINASYSNIFQKSFHIKNAILWRHTADFHYIVLSPHVINNARQYLDVDKLNFYPVVMPTVFSSPAPQAVNEFVKFAVFGYGNSEKLHKVALLLSQKTINKPYEIRIIGMDNRGTDGFPNIHCVSLGKPMPRKEMEEYVHDIDMFLSLYEKDRYRLSCSASALEALSYTKPILHFNNDTMNHFNTQEIPIGYSCANTEKFVEKMVDIINNYPAYLPELHIFRENMFQLREEYAIERSAPVIKSSFTFN